MVSIEEFDLILENKEYDFLNKKCKICITGGSGFIGSNLIRIIKSLSKEAIIFIGLNLYKIMASFYYASLKNVGTTFLE